MTQLTAVLAVLIILIPQYAYSDGRINARLDFNSTTVGGAYNDVSLDWEGFEVEVENEFKKPKVVLSGFSFGIRRDPIFGFSGFGATEGVHRWDEGTYLMLRVSRHFDTSGGRWSIGPSFAILYGIPGTTLDRTIEGPRGDARSGYTHIFPIRNNNLPQVLADTADLARDSALLYPEASLSIRQKLAGGGFVLEFLAGAKVIRFGIVDGSSQGNLFSEKRLIIPTVGFRAGFRIF
jgi:hypothetical protein